MVYKNHKILYSSVGVLTLKFIQVSLCVLVILLILYCNLKYVYCMELIESDSDIVGSSVLANIFDADGVINNSFALDSMNLLTSVNQECVHKFNLLIENKFIIVEVIRNGNSNLSLVPGNIVVFNYFSELLDFLCISDSVFLNELLNADNIQAINNSKINELEVTLDSLLKCKIKFISKDDLLNLANIDDSKFVVDDLVLPWYRSCS